VNPHGGQDWTGFVVIMGVLALVVLATSPRTAAWFRRQDDLLQELLDSLAAAPWPTLPDHTGCADPDCDQVICCCPRPTECTGCATVGCDHANPYGGLLCWDCRLGCPACADEHRAGQYADWAAGR
jgi:hypothetical protein